MKSVDVQSDYDKTQIFSLLVDNTAGVLSRIAGLFSRRSYNIDSLTVGETFDPRYSRLTVTATGNLKSLVQIERQLRKLNDVRDIKVLYDDTSVTRELMLIKLRVGEEQRSNVINSVNVFRAKIVDIDPDSLMVELTGTRYKLDAFIKLLEGYEILEIARTGLTGLSRGSEDVKYL